MNLWVLGNKTVVCMATGHGLKDMWGIEGRGGEVNVEWSIQGQNIRDYTPHIFPFIEGTASWVYYPGPRTPSELQ